MDSRRVSKIDPTWQVVITRGGNTAIFVAGIFENHTKQECDVVIGLEDSQLSESYKLILLTVIDAINSAGDWIPTDELSDRIWEDSKSYTSDDEGNIPF